MPEPLVVTMMRQFKLALLFREQAAMQAMVQRWFGVEEALEAQITALAHELREMRDAGQTIQEWKVYQMDRYQRLLLQTQGEMAKYAIYADGHVSGLQGDTATLGLQNALAAIEASYGGAVVPSFTRLPAEAVEFLVGYAGDGAPLGDLLVRRMIRGPGGEILPGTLDKLTQALINGTAMGRNPREVARMMRDSLSGGLSKALTIARTEGLRPYRVASQMSYQASGVVLGHKRLTAHDDRVCPACLGSEGQLLKPGEVMYDHPNGRCIVPRTIVSGPRALTLVSRYYKGDVVTIRTASGKLLSVTPNHPVLTDHGWFPARFLYEGCHVVSSSGGYPTPDSVPDDYQVPIAVKDVASTLDMSILARMPATAENFHGDGVGSDVYIIWANSLLGNRFNATLLQPLKKLLLCGRDVSRVTLFAFSNLETMFQRMFPSTRSLLSNGNTTVMFFDGGLGRPQSVSLSLPTPLYSSSEQTHSDDIARNIERFCQAVLRFPITVAANDLIKGQWSLGTKGGTHFLSTEDIAGDFVPKQRAGLEFIREALSATVESGSGALGAQAINVCLDRILEIGIRAFSGHVYNLQTKAQWYNADGIITHNCTSVPVVKGMPAVKWSSGEDWLRTQGRDVQEKILDNRWEAWSKGAFQLADVAEHTFDSVWGGSLQPRSLAVLLGET